MFRTVQMPAVIAALLAVCALPQSFVEAGIYAWTDAKGVMTFSDDPTQAPPGAQVERRAYGRFAADAEVTTRSPEQVSQGEFALRLAIELGLATADAGVERAIALLTQARISPPLGRWASDAPMTHDLFERLRTLTAAAAAAGRIDLEPEQALYAFDTASDLVGVAISERAPAQAAQPAPAAAAAPVPVYIVPVAVPVVHERVIFIGGDSAVFVPGAAPFIQVNKKIVNVRQHLVPSAPSMPAPVPAARRLRVPAVAADHGAPRMAMPVHLSAPAR